MNVIVITGASSGMGMEFVRQMDRSFYNIDEFWLVARSRSKLEKLAEELMHKSKVFAMDITGKKGMNRLERALKERSAVVRILVNCAGYGVMGAFENLDREQTMGMVRLNCEALTDMTYRILPFMTRNSRIIQLASSAAFMPQPDFAVYAASKAYVHSFSRALGTELKRREIYVTSVCPGPVDTPFFDIAEKDGTYLTIKKIAMAQPDQVVAQALRDSYYKRSVSVYSPLIKAFHVAAKVIPHSLILKGFAVLKKI